MGVLSLIKGIFIKPKMIKVPIDADSVRDNHRIKALAYENAELKGQKAKIETRIAQLKEREKDKDEEESVKKSLIEEREDLVLKSRGKVLSLSKIYNKLRDSKFKSKIGIYSFDRSTKLANFGDFGISEEGDFCIIDSNENIILKMEKLKDIFQSCGALGNDIARGIIPVNLDKEGGYIENIMTYEAPELISTGENLRFAKARKRPVYEIIQGMNETISGLQSDLEEAEAVNVELQKKVDTLSSENKLSQDMSETSRAELSHTEQRVSGIDKSFRTLKRDLFNYQNTSVILEDNLEKLESALNTMREKAEREGIKLSDEKALESLRDIRSTLANELPDIREEKVEQPEKIKR